MENKGLIETRNSSVFSRVKRWFKSLFWTANENQEIEDLEFEKQKNLHSEDTFEGNYNYERKMKYEFSSPIVSKQKIDRIRLDLDNGKAGIEDLYQLSAEELEELVKSFNVQIEDTVSRLNEIQTSITGYKRRLSKIQG